MVEPEDGTGSDQVTFASVRRSRSKSSSSGSSCSHGRSWILILALVALGLLLISAASFGVFLLTRSSSGLLSGECLGSSGSPMETLSTGTNDFSRRLYKAVGDLQSGQSVILSPLSVSAVLALASLGARGETDQEMKDSLSLPCDQEEMLRGYEQLTDLLFKGVPNLSLSMANRIFVNERYRVSGDFRSRAAKFFRASPESLNFDENLDGSIERINSWVESQTNDKIQDLIQPGSVHGATKVVLVNAVYFQGNWETQFNTLWTEKKPFSGYHHTSDVYMMKVESQFQTGRIFADCRVLKLPYKGRRASMYILLPDPTSDLATLEKNLTDSPGTLSTLELHLDPSYLTSVSLPRFQLEQTLDLSTPLQRLGAQRMFKPGEADFSGITDQERIHVDYAVQKAFIEVTETGTEAAAATGISFRSGSFVEPHEFKCDRPFLYLIKDEQTNMIWFMGRFLGPEKE